MLSLGAEGGIQALEATSPITIEDHVAYTWPIAVVGHRAAIGCRKELHIAGGAWQYPWAAGTIEQLINGWRNGFADPEAKELAA